MAVRFAKGWVQVGECLEERVWCPTCLLTTAFTFQLWLLTESGVQPHGPLTACAECRGHWYP